MRLQGKVALVTGAGSGNGRAMVMACAREGAAVVGVDLMPEGLAETMKMALDAYPRAVVKQMTGDVSSGSDVRRFIDGTVKEFGRLDVLVNNAGITGSQAATLAHSTPEEEWQRVLAINLTGVFLGCKYALPQMMRQGGGRIINVASVAGLVAFPGRCAYTASKGGVVQLTKSVAVDYAAHGITCNALCPGMIETPMTSWRLEQEHLRREVLAQIPAGRIGTPEDVAEAAVWLALPESSYMNGHCLVIDGGWVAR